MHSNTVFNCWEVCIIITNNVKIKWYILFLNTDINVFHLTLNVYECKCTIKYDTALIALTPGEVTKAWE